VKKNIGIIGVGYWGKNLVRNFYEIGALRTICDKDNNTLDNLIEKYPEINRTNSFSDILNNPEIEGVVIATPAETHADLVEKAIFAGKDVYVEKPLCLSEKEGERLVEFSKEQNKILMVGHLLWYHPVVLKLKSMVDSGELGRINYIYSNRLNLGKLRREENVLWSFAPHDVSVILGLLGEFPDEIWAKGGNFLHKELSDTTISLLDFPSGTQAHVFVSWLHPFKEQKLVVVGDSKMAVFDDTASWGNKLLLYPHDIEWQNNIPMAHKAEAENVIVERQEPLRAECQHFIDCIASRNIPRTSAEEGLRVLKVLNACQTSLETGSSICFRRKNKTQEKYYVHETAVIDDNVTIGVQTKIWHFSHILPDTTIGERCNVGQNVVIGPKVLVGDGCKIQNNVAIYEGIILEEDVFCGPSMVFTNVYNPRAAIRKMDQVRNTIVKKGATIGANATIVCGITIGSYSFIGAGSVVNKDVPSHALVVGNPAKQIGWVCECGETLPKTLECAVCKRKYRKINSTIKTIQ